MSRRLGLLGPAIVITGAAIAGLAIWYFLHARPHAGELIDAIPLDGGETLLVRAELGGDRAFLELHHGDELVWQALIPHYSGSRGRSGIAWTPTTITARVERGGRAEVFGLMRHTAAKVGGDLRLAQEHEPITTQPTGPITLTDHVRSYEIVGGTSWHQIICVDLHTGYGLWKVDLGAAPITAGAVEGGTVWVEQAGVKKRMSVFDGRDTSAIAVPNQPGLQ